MALNERKKRKKKKHTHKHIVSAGIWINAHALINVVNESDTRSGEEGMKSELVLVKQAAIVICVIIDCTHVNLVTCRSV